MKRICSECGTELEDSYYKCLDNFLQTKYFDSEEENCFCDEYCFATYLQLREVELGENNNE